MCETTRKAEFRPLRADEIDVRVQSVGKGNKGGFYAILLLYKDARVDMTLLDEKYGPFGWKRRHIFHDGKNYCEVSVRCPETGEWISKEDVGTESNTEAEKGEASDAFKRACVNIGIGRELYTTPSIIIAIEKDEITEWKDRQSKVVYRLLGRVRFSVASVGYDAPESVARKITALTIIDQNGKTRYKLGDSQAEAQEQSKTAAPPAKTKTKRISMRAVNIADQRAKMLAMLYEGYCKDKDKFTVEGYLRDNGFEIDDATLAVVRKQFTDYMIEKGL